MKDKDSRAVSMQCSACGGTDFAFDDDSGPVRCTGCARVYTRDELTRKNGARIEAEMEDVNLRIFEDIRKDLSKVFQKFK